MKTPRYFTVCAERGNVVLRVFDLDGSVLERDAEVVPHAEFGEATQGAFGDAIAYALALGAVPATTEFLARTFAPNVEARTFDVVRFFDGLVDLPLWARSHEIVGTITAPCVNGEPVDHDEAVIIARTKFGPDVTIVC